MRAGKLDRRLTIRRYTASTDNFGGEAKTWGDVATVWAQQRPIRGDERFSVQQVAGRKVQTFHIRYYGSLTTADRVLYEGREYNVTDVRELGRREVTEFDATARE